YKEEQEYAGLESEIEKRETEKSLLEEEINSGTLDYELLNSKSIRIAELIQEIDTLMERWMELDQLSG
ncbi:MAG: ABC transporter C-terminal domain-containing protein, partial [Bacteroidota bacterium]|nr:ABC transporter C-terminal domain-containing protein [Bacteroidota bacterium]